MAFSPFDGVLLQTNRSRIPGSVSAMLHFKVEHYLATRDKRTALSTSLILNKKKACDELLMQGLFPEQLRSMLTLGISNTANPRSLESLVEHLDLYLQAVDGTKDYLEIGSAIWKACDTFESSGEGFWTDRTHTDPRIKINLEKLTPVYLRAMEVLKGLSFTLEVAMGKDAEARKQPYLIKDLLDPVEAYFSEANNIEIDYPKSWATNPWGPALKCLFEQPLVLSPEVQEHLVRGITSNPFESIRIGVEQITYWFHVKKILADDITVIHSHPADIAPMLETLLAKEGISVKKVKGRSLKYTPEWSAALTLFEGLKENDPVRISHALAAASVREDVSQDKLQTLNNRVDNILVLGNYLRTYDQLANLDESFLSTLGLSSALLGELRPLWKKLMVFKHSKPMPLKEWATEITHQIEFLCLVHNSHQYYSTAHLLEEAWSPIDGQFSFQEMFNALNLFLEVALGEDTLKGEQGVRIISPNTLLRDWSGSRATLVLNLEEGSWPSNSSPNPFLDWERKFQINTTLRQQAKKTDNALMLIQTFWLPRVEDQETMPRAFQKDAFAFNKVLAQTTDDFLALYSERDHKEESQAPSVFWRALEGSGNLNTDPSSPVSHLGYRWQFSVGDKLSIERQQSILSVKSECASDRVPHQWKEGLTEENPISPTRLQSLTDCRFKVFGEKILNLRSPQDSNQLAAVSGTLVHKLMEKIYTLPNQPEAWSPHLHRAYLASRSVDASDPMSICNDIKLFWEEHCEALMKEQNLTYAQRQGIQSKMSTMFYTLAEFVCKDLSGVWDEPTMDEINDFGLAGSGSWTRQIVSLEDEGIGAVSLSHEGKIFWIKGTPDRIDQMINSDGETFMRVMDYKTSTISKLKKDVRLDDALGFNAHLQGYVYQFLIEERYQRKVSSYWVSLRDTKIELIKTYLPPGDDERRQRLRESIVNVLEHAVQGDFRPTPGDHCEYCHLSPLCMRPVEYSDAMSLDDDEESE